MTNTNVQAGIPLTGRGFVAKLEGHYAPGDYKHLSNAKITDDGVIVNRRAVMATGLPAETLLITDPWPYFGYINEYSIVGSKYSQRAVGSQHNYTLWSPTDLPVPLNGWHKIVGVFKYNNIIYWITLKSDPAVDSYTYWLYYATEPDAGFQTITYSMLASVLLVIEYGEPPILTNFFINKERLFLITSKKMYWSKATDPTVFAVPDGGFIFLPDKVIKYGFHISDIIYILCDNSVHAYTYSEDPNTDGYMRLISDNVGGEYGCIHNGSAYMVSQTGIFQLSGSSVQRIHNGKFDVGDTIHQTKMVSFEDYLVVLKRSSINYLGRGESDYYFYDEGKKFKKGEANNTIGHNLFAFNVSNGSVHTIDFTDCKTSPEQGYVTDIMVNPNKDFSGTYFLHLMTNRHIADIIAVPGATTYRGGTYIMPSTPSYFIYDTAIDGGNVPHRYKPAILIEQEGFTPDGNEYLIKKFRNMMFMAKFPNRDFAVNVSFDNHAYPDSGVAIINDVIPNNRPHYPARVSLMQRANSLNWKIYVVNPDVPMADNEVYDQLEISDCRIYYAYTGRGPTLQTELAANQS